MSSPVFDYHLAPKEQKKVESLVPLHQAKIHLAFRADITISGKLYSEGACALSEHMITLAKKKIIGSSFSPLETIHLISIKSISTSDLYTCTIQLKDQEVVIVTPIAVRFVRCLIRNYICISMLFPSTKRAAFSPFDFREYPPFDPHLSPSQMFQFAYNAYCSFFGATYFHDVVRLFHANVLCENAIFDLRRLPLYEIDCKFGEPLDLRPLFSTIGFCPIVGGIVCSGICRPDIVRSSALAIAESSTLRIVSLPSCKCDSGLSEVATAILSNPAQQISYWDFSGNPLRDATAFAIALSQVKSPVLYLNMSSCGLEAVETLNFINAISSNKFLWELGYIDFGGAILDKDGIDSFVAHLSALSTHGNTCIKYLNLGSCISDCGSLLSALRQWPQPIEVFKLRSAKFSTNSFNELIEFLNGNQYLKEIDLSSTNLKPENISDVISSIANNGKLSDFSILLDDLGLHGKKLAKVMSAFEIGDSTKWKMISLESNNITEDDLKSQLQIFLGLSHIRSLHIGGNLKKKDCHQILLELARIPTIEEFSIRGNSKKFIGDELIPFIQGIQGNMKSLDISGNRIGSYDCLAALVESSRQIQELFFDGSLPRSKDSFVRLLDSIAMSESLINAPFPMEDAYNLLEYTDQDSKGSVVKLLTNEQRAAQGTLEKNVAKSITSPSSSSVDIIEFTELSNQIASDMHRRLEGIQTNHHSGIGKAFGLQLPHLDENSADEMNKSDGKIADNDSYEMPEANITVTETVDENDSSFKTLQYNSLIIQRNGGLGRLQKLGGTQPYLN